MKTLIEVLKASESYLGERRLAEEVVSSALDMKRLDLYLNFERPITEEELERCRSILKRRKEGEPIQYIEGEVEFFDCRIKVTPDVLIPRPETELLVEKVLEEAHGVVWDVCCGSGCIGIAIKKARPDLTVIMSDISEKAVALARENARLNDVDVEVRVGDLLEPFDRADIVVSNPPYIKEEDYSTLSPEVQKEPRGALISGPTGLEFYKRFASELDFKCKLFFEIADPAVAELFEGQIEYDLNGLPRFFSVEFLPVKG